MITVSIVSHRHGPLLGPLLNDLAKCEGIGQVLLTLNVAEPPPAVPEVLKPLVDTVVNPVPKGFGANHNAAFQRATSDLFCILNPDIRLIGDPFPDLTGAMGRDVALVAPAVLSPSGEIEDSVRRFPGPWRLAMKALGRWDGRYTFSLGGECFEPEWVAGMFMLVRSDDFRRVAGFDERYFLYYEDVDLCTRLWQARRAVRLCPKAKVIHDARRASHRNLRYMLWHGSSMLRYLATHVGRLPRIPRQDAGGVA